MFQMIGTDGCEKCQQAKAILQERGLWEQVEFLDYEHDPTAKEMAEKYEATVLPFFIVEGKFFAYLGQLLRELRVES